MTRVCKGCSRASLNSAVRHQPQPVPVGRHASAGTDWKMNTEALSYSRTKGLFVGVAVDGAKIQQDNDSTVAFYGKNVSFRKTLSGDVHAPAGSDSFLAAVRAAEKQASQHEAAEAK